MHRLLTIYPALITRFLLLLLLPVGSAFAQPGGLYLGSQHQPVRIAVSGLYQRFADDAGYVSQASFPVSVFVPVGRSVAVSLLTAPAVADGTGLESLGGVTDAQLAVSYHRPLGNGSVVASLTANLPSGREALADDEYETALALSRAYYDFRVPTFGQGLSVAPGITVAFPVGERLALGLGAAYQYRGSFEPRSGLEGAYDPGDEITVTGGLDIRTGARSRLSGDVSYTLYQMDVFAGEDVYTPGGKVVLTAQFVQPFAGNEFRLLGRYRSRAGAEFPAVEEGGVSDVLRMLPNQMEIRGSLATGFTERAATAWLVQIRRFSEFAGLEPVFLFDVGALPRVAVTEQFTLTSHFLYTLGDLTGVEAGLGMAVTL